MNEILAIVTNDQWCRIIDRHRAELVVDDRNRVCPQISRDSASLSGGLSMSCHDDVKNVIRIRMAQIEMKFVICLFYVFCLFVILFTITS